MIFVFGSNRAGVHGAGAARHAHKNLGAKWGDGEGITGQCYALPTKDHRIQSLSIRSISLHVDTFVRYAEKHTEIQFQVTRIGCGLAGFKDKDIAPLFLGAPKNCHFDTAWQSILGDSFNYWGTV